jgi:hypothetical protein
MEKTIIVTKRYKILQKSQKFEESMNKMAPAGKSQALPVMFRPPYHIC